MTLQISGLRQSYQTVSVSELVGDFIDLVISTSDFELLVQLRFFATAAYGAYQSPYWTWLLEDLEID